MQCRIPRLMLAQLFVLPLLLCGVMAGRSQADLVISGPNADLVISGGSSVGDGSEDLVLLLVQLVGHNASSKPIGFDGSLSGTLHQQDLGVTGQTPTTAQILGTTVATTIDTHFLFESSSIIATTAPAENRNLSGSSEAPDATGPVAFLAETTFGSTLSGVFALTSTPQQTWNLAQLVVPRNSSVGYNFKTAFATGAPGEQTFSGSFNASAVPEPSAVWFGVLASCGAAIVRVRRHARSRRCLQDPNCK